MTSSNPPPNNGLANSPFHSLVFGISGLQSGEMSYFRAKYANLGLIVQLLCNEKSSLVGSLEFPLPCESS